MKKSDVAYFSMLRSALWNEKASFDDDVNVTDVLKTAQRQTTTGLVCHAILQNDVGAALSPENKVFLRRQMLKIAMMHNFINATTARIVAALREKGIESVLMKGQGVAANYPIAELRQCGDIDLYVGKHNFDAACAIVNEMAGEEEAAKGHGHSFHYHVVVDKIIVEVHRLTHRFSDNKTDAVFQSYSDEGMRAGKNAITINGVNVWLPSDTFNAFFVFIHTFGHFLSIGVGMRQICDWVMFLHKKCKTIDREELSDILHRLQLMDEWQVFGSIAVDYLHLPEDEMPFYEKNHDKRARRAIDMILTEGNFGKESERLKKRLSRKGLRLFFTAFINIQIRHWHLLWVVPKAAWRHYKTTTVNAILSIFK